jgi:hypothetical protein
VTVEATAEECAALAKDFKLPAIHELRGDFRLSGSPSRVHVEGAVRARVTQTCVVTLDPFDDTIEEQVEVDFTSAAREGTDPAAHGVDYEPPEEIVAGHIDLGALTAEFLALGLDPYPRKPGASFAFDSGDAGEESPFAGLGKLKGSG